MTRDVISAVLGPRVEAADRRGAGIRFGTPGFLLLAARVLILVSLFLPYWHMELVAPQYPENLQLTAHVNTLGGDVAEIDGLNHYIGMRPLGEAAQIERRFGVYGLILLAVMLEFAAFIHTRWAVLLVLPAVFFPVVFLVDLHLWMSHFGMNLDPYAPLSNSIKPFSPPVLGTGVIGQFKTIARPGIGLYLCSTASVVMVAAMFFHRRAYRPLVIARRKAAEVMKTETVAD